VNKSATGGLLLALMCALLGGCGSKGERSVAREPVEECKQYEALLASCLHRPMEFAKQESLIPKTHADRERIKQVCSENLQRLKSACL
jgi:hypothetical protein